MKCISRLLTLFVLIVTLVGCSKGLVIGDEPTDPPPQIVFLGAKDAAGEDYLSWRHVSSFGQVPESLKAQGDISCMRYGFELRAVGYHPQARDRKGNAIPNGGYFCSPVSFLEASSTPPQLIQQGEQLSWDRPSAFGPVSDAQRPRGSEVCSLFSATAYPLGYHREALDAQGNLLPDGGYLCVEPIVIDE